MLSRKALAASVEATGGGGIWDVTSSTFQFAADTYPFGIPYGFRWRPDGSAHYVVESTTIYEYNSNGSFIPSTSLGGNTFAVSGAVSTLYSLVFSQDGTKIYTSDGYDFFQINLSTAWDLSTASTTISAGLSLGLTTRYLLDINGSGTEIIVLASNGYYALTMTTPYDITTASLGSFVSKTLLSSNPRGGKFTSDGSQAMFVDYNGDTVYVVNLSTAYDMSTATVSSSYYYGGTQSVANSLDALESPLDFFLLYTPNDFVYKYTM